VPGGNFVPKTFPASPFWIGQSANSGATMLASHCAAATKFPVVLVNQVGGKKKMTAWCSTDRSVVLNREGVIIAQGKSFEEDPHLFSIRAICRARCMRQDSGG